METYDDRPISVYDNLNNNPTATTTTTRATIMHTSTPKTKVHTALPPFTMSTTPTTITTTAVAATATTTTKPANVNGAKARLAYDETTTTTPNYAELSFKFDDNMAKARQSSSHIQQQQQQQQQLQPQHQHQQQQQQSYQQPLNNSNKMNSSNSSNNNTGRGSGFNRNAANNMNLNQKQLQTNDVYYATPFKSTAQAQTAQTTAATPALLPTTSTTFAAPSTAAKSKAAAAASAAATTTTPASMLTSLNAQPTYASPVRVLHAQQQRPLSQHSQSEVNEASQNIAAVKAALNDAKSKFFGLNGYTSDETTIPIHQQHQHQHQQHLPLVQSAQNPAVIQQQQQQQPIAKPQPKYQNIPENSAIFRSQQPPELPPKPIKAHSPSNESTPSEAATTIIITAPTPTPPSPPINMNSHHHQHPQSTITATNSTPSPSGSTRASPEYHQHSPSPQPSKILPYSTYQQLPLNDIDSPTPSQAVYMSTTVPQNIKSSKISGRHTPTRNSLRHSRMLVINNTSYRELQQLNPMNFVYPNLARWLLILQLIVGFLLGFLAIWIFFLTPSTPIQDNPYWSGLALILTGLIGLVLIRYERIKRHKVREKCFLFLRADSYLLSLLAIVLCCAALTCAAIHHYRVTASDTHCESTNPLLENGSCTCTFNAVMKSANASIVIQGTTNGLKGSTAANNMEEQELLDRSYKVEYRDLTCQEVKCEWVYILVLSIILNTFGLIISVLYIMMLACYRRSSKALYATVHSSTF